MIELLLVCAVSALAFAIAFRNARSLFVGVPRDENLVAVAARVALGASRFLRRQHLVTASLAAVLAGVMLVAFGVAYQVGTSSGMPPRTEGLVVASSFVVGVAAALLVAWTGSYLGVQASLRTAQAARISLDEAMTAGLRGGTAVGLVAHATGTLVVAVGALGLFAWFGGLRGSRDVALLGFVRIPSLLAGAALGASVVALLGRVGGGIFARVADIGADVAGQLESGLPEDAASNPATVADLVGDQVGESATLASSALASTIAEVVTAMMVGALVFRDSPALPSVTAVVLLPLVIRVFCVLAGWFGALVVRTDDTEPPLVALQRGFVVTSVLAGVSMLGASTWLLGAHGAALGGAAVVGLGASVTLFFVVTYFSEQRFRPVRTVAETAQSGASLATLRGLLVASDASVVSIGLVTIAALFAHRLGARTGLTHGGLFGLALALCGMRGVSVFARAMGSLGAAVDTAAGLLELTFGGERPDVHARARSLAGVGTSVKGYLRVVDTVATVVAVLLLVSVFRGAVAEGGRAAVDATRPVVLLGGVAGLVVVVTFGRVLLGGIVQAGRGLVEELRHRLRSHEDVVDLDGERRPSQIRDASHEACVESVSRSALRGMLPPALVGVVAPLAVGVGLRLSASGDSVRSSAEAIVALVIVATVAGGLGSLLFANAGSAWDNAKRYIETGAHGGRTVRPSSLGSATTPEAGLPSATTGAANRADGAADLNPTYAAAVVGDTIGDPLKGAVGPAIVALVETLALLVTAFHSFFL
ncbi:MAG: sodium/proton-translocating pyrophosphatase [Deltaproteobacteria bacterium]|nr:sodium/proton-translocating pyrophosphatase [Deltaproteobacteria bacterium]